MHEMLDIGQKRGENRSRRSKRLNKLAYVTMGHSMKHPDLRRGSAKDQRLSFYGASAATILFFLFWLFAGLHGAAAQQSPAANEDNFDSIAVIIGNKTYKQTVPVDFAQNDAKAMRDYLVKALGYRESNIIFLEDATLNEFNQTLGTETKPQSGKLWRLAQAGRSNIFVYYSGHGVPDLQTREPYLLPHDGSPNQSESGYLLSTLYANLNVVKQKIGPDRKIILMIDACFTGETGRKGETLLSVSAPGFAPALPTGGQEIIKLLATSAATPANWDQTNKLGLFTSQFLMGASGLADEGAGNKDGAIQWTEMKAFLTESVERRARESDGREQRPEVDDATLVLRPFSVAATEGSVATARDEMNWRAAQSSNSVAALEDYVAQCKTCAFRKDAMAALIGLKTKQQGDLDGANWRRLSAEGKYQEYIDGCKKVCAYKALALSYLEVSQPSEPEPGAKPVEPQPDTPKTPDKPKAPDKPQAGQEPSGPVVGVGAEARQCDEAAAWYQDTTRPSDIAGLADFRVDAETALVACKAAIEANPDNARFLFQLGRAHQRLEKFTEARAIYEQAVEKGYLPAKLFLSYFLVGGVGGPRDPERALDFVREAEKANIPDAIAQIGYFYYVGQAGIPRSFKTAVEYFQRAADFGSPEALSNLGILTASGQGGLTADPAKSAQLLQSAADAGSQFALSSLADLYLNGMGVTKSETEAVRLYKEGLERSDYYAMAQMGVYSLNGFQTVKGVPKSDKTAASYFKRGAEGGDNQSRTFLAYMYSRGLGGLPKSDAKAYSWFKLAADGDYCDAMISMANFHDQGRAVARSSDEAALWLYKSLQTGNNLSLNLAKAAAFNSYTKPTRQAFQTILQREGFYNGTIDGTFGPQVEKAIRAAFDQATKS